VLEGSHSMTPNFIKYAHFQTLTDNNDNSQPPLIIIQHMLQQSILHLYNTSLH
jgi:hypothetical protein